MNNTAAIAFVLVFLTACGTYTYQATHPHRGSLLKPPGYPADEHVTELARRGLR